MSTTDAEDTRRYAAEAAKRDIDALEAPVTGGVNRAWTGEISILVGETKASLHASDRCSRRSGVEIEHMGPIGAASIVKVTTNMLAFAHL